MQEGTVGWDPQYMTHDPGWAVRFYLWYLVIALCYALVKIISVAKGYSALGKAAAPAGRFRQPTKLSQPWLFSTAASEKLPVSGYHSMR